MMQIFSAEFIKGSTKPEQYPVTSLPEFAFIGRSNVGKSSLINLISGRRKLALVSRQPGKTLQINHFLLNGEWFLADLPGYGFARVSKTVKEKLEKMVRQYLTGRQNLRMTFLLIDSRHAPQDIDIFFMKWLYAEGIPFTILFTKADKLSVSRLVLSEKTYRKALSAMFPELPELIPTSVISKKGKKELLDLIEKEIQRSSPPGNKDTTSV